MKTVLGITICILMHLTAVGQEFCDYSTIKFIKCKSDTMFYDSFSVTENDKTESFQLVKMFSEEEMKAEYRKLLGISLPVCMKNSPSKKTRGQAHYNRAFLYKSWGLTELYCRNLMKAKELKYNSKLISNLLNSDCSK